MKTVDEIMSDLPDLHTLGPVTQVFPQQQVVESVGADKVEELTEDLLHQFRVHSVHIQDTHVIVKLKQKHMWDNFVILMAMIKHI